MTLVHEQTFTSLEVCRLAGITYRQLDYWCRTAAIFPMVPADGSGTTRRFCKSQVRVIRALGELSRLGVCMQAFRNAASELTELELAVPCWLVVAQDGSVEVALSAEAIPAVLEKVPEASWVVPVAA